MFRTADSPDAVYTETMELDLAGVVPSLSQRAAGFQCKRRAAATSKMELPNGSDRENRP